jgi:dTDP-4-amino-4,6-dideoxygalactose transaminase
VRLTQAGQAERARSALHLYVLQIDFAALNTTRKDFMLRLRQQGVGSQVHYIPISRQPYHAKRLRAGRDAFPATEAFYARALSIPLHPSLTDEDVEHVIATVSRVATER